MCGIVSLFSTERGYDRDVHSAMSQLLSANTVRGIHSTGLAFGGGFEADVYKKAVPGYDFVELAVTKRILTNYEKNQFLIGHNRAATKGVVSSENAHPFQHGHITGVHNGTLVTYRALVEGTDPMYDVDSEYIFRGLEQSGAAELIPLINGAYTLIWHDATDNTVHMIRNEERPYYFAAIKGKSLLFGASEMPMLQWILNRNGLTIMDVVIPEAMTEYVFDLEGNIMMPTEIKHEEYKYVAPAVIHSPPSTHQHGGYNPNQPIPQRIPRAMDFLASNWESYGPSSNGMGKWMGKTAKDEDIIVYQADEQLLIAGKWYTGMTRTQNSEYSTYAVDGTTVKMLGGDGPRDATEEEMYRCVVCKDYYTEDKLIFCDATPMCNSCVSHYEIQVDDEGKK